MNYFKKNETSIEKYDVKFERDEIERLRIEVINNCSEIFHREYDSTQGPNQFDYLKIRNYKQQENGYQEYIDGPDEPVYHFTYNEYKYPYLISLIDRLLDGEESTLEEIFNYTPTDKRLSIEDRIKIMSDEIDQIPNIEVDEKTNKLEELKQLIEHSKLNSNQKPTEQYYLRLQELIQLELVDTISTDELTRVSAFWGDNSSLKDETKLVYKKVKDND